MKLVGNNIILSSGLWLACLIAIVPILLVLGSLFIPMDQSALETWEHVRTHLLGRYISHSLILLLGVGFLTTLLGVSSALLVHLTTFPFKRFFSIVLLFPLSIPSYIAAYSYTSLLDTSSPIGGLLQATLGIENVPIRSLGGTIFIFSFTLFPYVYLFTRAMLTLVHANMVDAARSLGSSQMDVIKRVILPACRPGIIAGISLVLMETLSDFGTVSLFGVQTFTTGIYKSWFNLQEPLVAAKLSGFLLIMVGLLIVIEKRSRRRSRYTSMAGEYRPLSTIPLSRLNAWLASSFCFILFSLGFIIPLIEILRNLYYYSSDDSHSGFFSLLINSVSIGLIAALVTSLLALGFYLGYKQRSTISRAAGTLLKMGYGIPGSVIAVGILMTFVGIERGLEHIGLEVWLSGGLLGLICAYVIRFVSISMQHTESGMEKLTPELIESARSLGCSGASLFRKIHWPLLKAPLLAGFFMVFVDVMKELPATMILRPFDFSSLAVQTYQYASDDRMVEASPYAISIILVCAFSTLLLQRVLNK